LEAVAVKKKYGRRNQKQRTGAPNEPTKNLQKNNRRIFNEWFIDSIKG